MGLFSGKRPDNLGVRDARLAPPKRTPNNVHSQIDRNADALHYIEPLRYSGDAAKAWVGRPAPPCAGSSMRCRAPGW